jgi:hypothetical protein
MTQPPAAARPPPVNPPRKWNEGELQSFLIEISSIIMAKKVGRGGWGEGRAEGRAPRRARRRQA